MNPAALRRFFSAVGDLEVVEVDVLQEGKVRRRIDLDLGGIDVAGMGSARLLSRAMFPEITLV